MPPECPKCGDSFSTSHGAKSHHKQVHGERLDTVPGAESEPVECPTCGEEFASQRAVQTHHAHSHDERLEPPIGCERLHELYISRAWPMTKIADEYDVSTTTVRKWMGRCNITIRDISTAKAEGDVSYLQDREWLQEQYCDLERSAREIADECGMSYSAVIDWLERHGIERRTLSEEMAQGDVSQLHEEDWLREQYCERERSAVDIAEECNVSPSTVCNWLERHGIERRDRHKAQAEGDIAPLRDREWLKTEYWERGKTATEIGEELGVYDSTVNRWLDRHDIEKKGQSVARAGEEIEQLEDAEWLRKQYYERELSTVEIAEKVGVTSRCVNDWMQRHGIERRGWTGEDNPMWKGGKDDYYGPSWPSARRNARDRDDYSCQRCGMTDAEHTEKYGQALHVHHIEPFRTFDDHSEANRLGNLVTLCRECHDQLEGLPIDFRLPSE